MSSLENGSHSESANHGDINPIPTASKPVILPRLYDMRKGQTRKVHAGLSADHGCVDRILAIRQLLEHRFIFQGPTAVMFLDIRVAFDSVNRSVLPPPLLRRIMRRFSKSSAVILRVELKLIVSLRPSSQFSVQYGTAIMYIHFFNSSLEDVLQSAFLVY